MPRRYHCEFKDCFCTKFKDRWDYLCCHCKHANIWHSQKEKPPTDHKLSFVSPRQPARSPQYEKVSFAVEIFEPVAPVMPIVEEIVYCTDIEILPV